MKTLKLRSLAAVVSCLALFASCTKDLDTSAAASQSSYDYYASSNTKKGGPAEGMETVSQPGQGGREAAMAIINNLQLVSNPSTVGSTVNLNADISFTDDVYKAQIKIQKSVTRDSNGEWIDWFDVEEYRDGQIDLEVATRSFTVDYSFKATEVGQSGWRLHFLGKDVYNTFSAPETLTVTDCVTELTIKTDVDEKDLGDGNYEFTITYILTSPTNLDNIKFQGGATSGGQFQHKMGENLVGLKVLHANKQNTVLYYTGSLEACQPLKLSFSYIRKFSCSDVDAQVTGDWTLESNNVEVATIAPLVYKCN